MNYKMNEKQLLKTFGCMEDSEHPSCISSAKNAN